MSRILILSDDSFSLWQFRRELTATMIGSEMEVVIATIPGSHIQDLQDLGCKIIEISVDTKAGEIQQYRSFLSQSQVILKSEQPDIVITYGTRPTICGGLACKKQKITHCAHIQGLGNLTRKTLRSAVAMIAYRSALKSAKVVFFENGSHAALFRDKKIVTEAQQMILPGAGVNLQHHTCQPYPANDPIRFLYLGRLKQEKGTDELLSAIKMLYDDCYEVRLDLVGDCDDNYKEQLEELKSMGIAAIHGFQEDPRPYYAACDCVIMPSHSEGMSNVLLEAAATGRPVIASYIPGCREAIEEARTGFAFRTQDKYALYETMARFARMPREQREEMGLAGRRLMEESFDRQIVVDETMHAIFRP